MSFVDRWLGADEYELEPETDPLESRLDDVFTALMNSRRRFIIDNLADRDDDEWVGISELSEAIAVIENDGVERPRDLSSIQRKNVYVVLYQTHFPRLAGWGLLEVDDRGHNVRKTDSTMAARRLLRDAYQEAADGLGWYR